ERRRRARVLVPNDGRSRICFDPAAARFAAKLREGRRHRRLIARLSGARGSPRHLKRGRAELRQRSLTRRRATDDGGVADIAKKLLLAGGIGVDVELRESHRDGTEYPV